MARVHVVIGIVPEEVCFEVYTDTKKAEEYETSLKKYFIEYYTDVLLQYAPSLSIADREKPIKVSNEEANSIWEEFEKESYELHIGHTPISIFVESSVPIQ